MFSRKVSRVVITSIGLALLDCRAALANFVTNGGFESWTGSSSPKNFISSVAPTDWAGGGYAFVDAPGTADDPTQPGVPVWGPFPSTSPQGGNFIEADGSSGLAQPLTQTITGLTNGQSYTVSFYQAAGQQYLDSGATTEQWQVTLGSSTQYSSLMNNPSQGVTLWGPQTLTLTADNTTDTLSFLAIGSGGVPPFVFLDGVDMESTVPEPSALLLLGGVGIVAAISRVGRRARAKPSAT